MSEQTEAAAHEASRVPTLVGVILAAALIPIGITVGGVSLPTIGADLDASFGQLQWVVNGYNLTLSALLLTSGSMADLFGRRRVLKIGLLVHTLGALIAGLAPDAITLDIFRAVQGVGGAMLLAAAPAVLANEFRTREERAKAFGMLGAAFGIGLVLGPVIGGLMSEHVHWRGAFLLAVPVGLLIYFFATPKMRESKDPAGGKVDWLGLVTFTGALFFLILGIIEAPELGWGSETILAYFAAAAVLLIAFIIAELKQKQPMFDLKLFLNSSFAGANLIAIFSNLNLVSMLTFLGFYMQVVVQASPFEAAFWMIPYTIMLFISPFVTGYIAQYVSPRTLITLGLVSTAVGTYWMTWFDAGADWIAYFGGAILAGNGVGMVMGLNDNVAVSSAPAERAGMATGMFNTNRIFGDAIAVAGAGAILATVVFTSFPGVIGDKIPAIEEEMREVSQLVSKGNLDAAAAVSELTAEEISVLEAAAVETYSQGFDVVLYILTAIALLAALCAIFLIRLHGDKEDDPKTEPVPDAAD